MDSETQSADPTAVRGRLWVTFALAISFLASKAVGIASEGLLAPLYSAAMVMLIVAFNWVQGARLRSFLRTHFPEEHEKLFPRENHYGYNSLRELQFALSSERADAPALALARQNARSALGESILMFATMIAVIHLGER
jgi:hypothetical protein